MYQTTNRLSYPKPSEIEVVREDVVDKDDPQEHHYNIKVQDRIVMSLTEEELVTIISKGNFALQVGHEKE